MSGRRCGSDRRARRERCGRRRQATREEMCRAPAVRGNRRSPHRRHATGSADPGADRAPVARASPPSSSSSSIARPRVPTRFRVRQRAPLEFFERPGQHQALPRRTRPSPRLCSDARASETAAVATDLASDRAAKKIRGSIGDALNARDTASCPLDARSLWSSAAAQHRARDRRRGSC